MERLAERLERLVPGLDADHAVPPAGLPEREDLLAAAIEPAGERGDRLRVAAVLEELVALEAQPGHDVGPDERLARVVEDPEDVAGLDEQALMELEPAASKAWPSSTTTAWYRPGAACQSPPRAPARGWSPG